MLDLRSLIDDRPDDGVFRVHRRLLSDPDVFELEMRHLFERGWVFLGMEAQLPEPHDYFTAWIGRQPVLLMRNAEGAISGFFNICPHRGARLCNLQQGNARVHVCGYHGWSFDSAGRNRGIKNRTEGGYPDSFFETNQDLIPLPRLDAYRGLIFGSLEADGPSLAEYLGEARGALDLTLDQSPDGLEIVPGIVRFTYDANWKLQLENCADTYHFSSVHPSYLRISERRARRKEAPRDEERGTEGIWERTRVTSDEAAGTSVGGSFMFAHGHVMVWARSGVVPGHPLFERAEELGRRLGADRRDWMFYPRNLTIFPNVQFADNVANQLRIIRPLSPSRTEMITYCLAPRGEGAEARRQRLRQYEDFFNPTGMATPDDAVLYENCQHGAHVEADPWLRGYIRGMALCRAGGNEYSDRLGIRPSGSVVGSNQLCDETLFQSYYRVWLDRLETGQAADAAAAMERV